MAFSLKIWEDIEARIISGERSVDISNLPNYPSRVAIDKKAKKHFWKAKKSIVIDDQIEENIAETIGDQKGLYRKIFTQIEDSIGKVDDNGRPLINFTPKDLIAICTDFRELQNIEQESLKMNEGLIPFEILEDPEVAALLEKLNELVIEKSNPGVSSN